MPNSLLARCSDFFNIKQKKKKKIIEKNYIDNLFVFFFFFFFNGLFCLPYKIFSNKILNILYFKIPIDSTHSRL